MEEKKILSNGKFLLLHTQDFLEIQYSKSKITYESNSKNSVSLCVINESWIDKGSTQSRTKIQLHKLQKKLDLKINTGNI